MAHRGVGRDEVTRLEAKPVIGLVLGDASGIGPEVCAKVLANRKVRETARLLVVGDARILRLGIDDAGVDLAWRSVAGRGEVDWTDPRVPVLDLGNLDPAGIERGQVSAAAGQAAGESLARATELALDGTISAVTYAPLNKAALHAGGWHYPDDLHLLSALVERRTGKSLTGLRGEINMLEGLWTSRVTSHVPLREVASHLSIDTVLDAIRLIDGALRRAGKNAPRIAVAALNPHAGDNGLCGDEEITIIQPAVERAQALGIACSGPFAADTVFLRARAGAFDAAVSMYHDQGQIATKLLGFNHGVTVLAGLPVIYTTPAHGTAHDIAGQGKANAGALEQALLVAARMVAGRPR
jgi:4-hydroxythreonine-4-phosphate dehydrogenase